jgi:restriction system protein
MAKKNESILNLLARCPWWVSIALSGISYLVLKYIVPAFKVQQDLGHAFLGGLIKAAPMFAPIVAFLLLIPAPVSLFHSRRKRRLLDYQKSIDTVRNLSWKEFEELVGEAYRRQGYTVFENTGAGPDGWVDLRLKKNNELVLVQCKQWRNIKVGVDRIRELYGIQVSENADRSILMTSGFFTRVALNFAANKPIDLIDGSQLFQFIKNVQPAHKPTSEDKKAIVACPQCGSEMVLRTARKGANAGQQFWGCSKFPACRGTRKLEG